MFDEKALLIIFAKYPEAGQVKSRLAEAIGAERASLLYRLLAQAVLLRTRPAAEDPYTRCVYYTPKPRAAAMRTFLNTECGYQGPMVLQAEGNLGTRLWDACTRSFAAGVRRVVIIGTDAPLLSRGRVLEALDRLQSAPVVLGPAADGGYYLIGLSTLVPDLFQGISWSTDQVYTETVKKIEQLGLTFASLPLDADVDDLAALERLRAALRSLAPAEQDGLSTLSSFLEGSS